MSYVGRFAPSPTGRLHFGSLLAAVASYCDARAHDGAWLLRIEDIDPPREEPGAADDIQEILSLYGMHSDGEVIFQHQRSDAYEEAIRRLSEQGDIFWCQCSRKDLAAHPIYPGSCRNHRSAEVDAAIRLRVPSEEIVFEDRIFGEQHADVSMQTGDFVIKRRDHLYAYQLAVVVDDAWQGVTHIIRGADLIDNTARQILLQRRLGYTTPVYAHIPMAINASGEKLSKQNRALPLPRRQCHRVLSQALSALGHTPPASVANGTVCSILDWAIEHWSLHQVPVTPTIPTHDQAKTE